MHRLFLTAFAILSLQYCAAQVRLKDFEGEWEDMESGWWISMHIEGTSLTMFNCYDGKALPGRLHALENDTLTILVNYMAGDFRIYRLVLTDKTHFTESMEIEGYVYTRQYKLVSRRFRNSSECHF
jgi:hypothetical protein